jgi:hypothetical protein
MAGPLPLLALVLAAAVAGCAAAEPGFSPPSAKSSRLKALLPTGGGMSAEGRYTLNDHEQKLDCKKINGIIHVGILQLRQTGDSHHPTVASKVVRTAISPVVVTSQHGADPDADQARGLARIEALNARLAEKGCATFNLQAELAPGNTQSPAPVKPDKGR